MSTRPVSVAELPLPNGRLRDSLAAESTSAAEEDVARIQDSAGASQLPRLIVPLWAPNQLKNAFLPSLLQVAVERDCRIIVLIERGGDWPAQEELLKAATDLTLNDVAMDVSLDSETRTNSGGGSSSATWLRTADRRTGLPLWSAEEAAAARRRVEEVGPETDVDGDQGGAIRDGAESGKEEMAPTDKGGFSCCLMRLAVPNREGKDGSSSSFEENEWVRGAVPSGAAWRAFTVLFKKVFVEAKAKYATSGSDVGTPMWNLLVADVGAYCAEVKGDGIVAAPATAPASSPGHLAITADSEPSGQLWGAGNRAGLFSLFSALIADNIADLSDWSAGAFKEMEAQRLLSDNRGDGDSEHHAAPCTAAPLSPSRGCLKSTSADPSSLSSGAPTSPPRPGSGLHVRFAPSECDREDNDGSGEAVASSSSNQEEEAIQLQNVEEEVADMNKINQMLSDMEEAQRLRAENLENRRKQASERLAQRLRERRGVSKVTDAERGVDLGRSRDESDIRLSLPPPPSAEEAVNTDPSLARVHEVEDAPPLPTPASEWCDPEMVKLSEITKGKGGADVPTGEVVLGAEGGGDVSSPLYISPSELQGAVLNMLSEVHLDSDLLFFPPAIKASAPSPASFGLVSEESFALDLNSAQVSVAIEISSLADIPVPPPPIPVSMPTEPEQQQRQEEEAVAALPRILRTLQFVAQEARCRPALRDAQHWLCDLRVLLGPEREGLLTDKGEASLQRQIADMQSPGGLARLAATAELAVRCLGMCGEGGCCSVVLLPTRQQFEFAVDMIAASPGSAALIVQRFV